jgi:hypothetical protein
MLAPVLLIQTRRRVGGAIDQRKKLGEKCWLCWNEISPTEFRSLTINPCNQVLLFNVADKIESNIFTAPITSAPLAAQAKGPDQRKPGPLSHCCNFVESRLVGGDRRDSTDEYSGMSQSRKAQLRRRAKQADPYSPPGTLH